MKELQATRPDFSDLARRQPQEQPSANLLMLSPETMILDKRNSHIPIKPLLPSEPLLVKEEIDEDVKPDIVIKQEI